ncbi:MAG TPA: aminoglycoside phosphotransferase family protein [Terriglobales bacterium]|nr:aminoglycoside phosphotransferase family protein [Terriglobales bacterium]
MELPDLASVRAFLRASCSADVVLDDLEVRYLQAGPDGPVRVLYEGPGRRGDLLRVAARRLGPVKGRRLEATINERCVPSAAGFRQPAVYAAAWQLLFQIFPADQHLTSLPVATDARAMAPILEDALRERGEGRVRDVAVQVVRYKPERKCLLRYDLTWSVVAGPSIVYARVGRQSRFDRARHTLPRLWAAASGDRFILPKPLGVVPSLCMELFGPVPGVILFTLVQTEEFPDLCRQVGLALNRFHTLPVLLDDRFGVEAQIGRLAENAEEFAWMLPGERGRVAALARALDDRLRSVPPVPSRPIHRDFHGDNVLVDDGRIAFLDFEDCAMGDPADDVGSNWAQLTWHALKAGARRAGPDAGRRAFLEGYLQDADPSITGRLPLYAALHCFLYAHQCLRHPQDLDRYEDAAAMLAVCERVLQHGLA